MVIPFPCKQCGKCCNMLERSDLIGISLFPWEKHLFPDKYIRPCLGIGKNPEHPNFKVILYIYDLPGCIHLDGTNCTIYAQRPLVCRSYPFRITKQGKKTLFIVAPECKVVEEWPKKKIIKQRYFEMDAAELIVDNLSRFYKATEPKWRFSHEKKWVRIGTNKTCD